MGLWKSYLRWRHLKGFGVHSPYAYRFIINVLRPGPYLLYSYHEIDRHLNGREIHDHKFLWLIRFTIRLVVFLKSKRIIGTPSATRLTEITGKSIDMDRRIIKSEKDFRFKEGDLLLVGNPVSYSAESGSDIILVENAIKNRIPVFALNPSPKLREIMEKPLEKGLLLNGKHRMILIPRQEMNYVAYDIALSRSAL